MPTYAYACRDCGHNFDIVQSFSDDSLTVCPECEGKLRKVFNAVGVVFKGSGFYRNDSRSSTTGSSSGSSSETSASSETSTPTSTSDAKPAAASTSTESSSSSTSAGGAKSTPAATG